MSYIYIYILQIPYGYRDIVKIHNILILNLLIIHYTNQLFSYIYIYIYIYIYKYTFHIYVSFVAQDLTLDETYVQD